MTLSELMELNEDRRPGVRRIAEELRRQHPNWDTERLAAEAKVLWHKQRDTGSRQPEYHEAKAEVTVALKANGFRYGEDALDCAAVGWMLAMRERAQ